jgi:UDP-N-acetylglucosamine 3-dehydrogenase
MIRVGVVGAGVMGRNHLRVLSDLEDVELVAVCDADRSAVESAAQLRRIRAYVSSWEMLSREGLNFVVVAAPTKYHHRLTLEALEKGCHVLVEKPIAADLAQARQMVTVAAQRGLTLAVGQIERFNPAVRELKRLLDQGYLGRIFQIRAQRLGPFPVRIRDVGVVADLATHDLDVMTYLLGRRVVRMYSETHRKINTEHEDMLNAVLKFDDGVIGVLDVNWLTPTKVRQLSVLGERGLFQLNYLTQELLYFENTDVRLKGNGSFSGVSEGNMTRFQIRQVEPLRAELLSVLRSVNQGTPPEVGGEDGYNALALALSLVSAGEEGRVIELAESLAATPAR